MLFLQFAAAVVISWLGLLAGFILATMTKEELPTAKKYFPWLEKLVALAVAAFVMDFFSLSLVAKAAAYVVLLAFFIFSYNAKFVYAAFGAAVFAVSRNSSMLLITAALVFLFGLLSGSNSFKTNLRKRDMVKAAAKVLTDKLFYPAVAIMLFLAFSK